MVVSLCFAVPVPASFAWLLSWFRRFVMRFEAFLTVLGLFATFRSCVCVCVDVLHGLDFQGKPLGVLLFSL